MRHEFQWQVVVRNGGLRASHQLQKLHQGVHAVSVHPCEARGNPVRLIQSETHDHGRNRHPNRRPLSEIG